MILDKVKKVPTVLGAVTAFAKAVADKVEEVIGGDSLDEIKARGQDVVANLREDAESGATAAAVLENTGISDVNDPSLTGDEDSPPEGGGEPTGGEPTGGEGGEGQ